MKKNGFTLAEVLVTLGIIGVVAALAMPALNSAVQKNKVGPSLRKFMNAIENANRIVMQESTVDDLSEVLEESCIEIFASNCKQKDNGGYVYMKKINKVLSSASVANDRSSYTDNGNIYATNDYQMTMGSGEMFRIEKYTGGTRQSKTNYKGSIFKIQYDMNGFNVLPNKDGKDRFYFYVDKNGAVLPIGSDAAVTAYGGTKAVANNSNATCDAENCSGAIANNGWKVGYKY